MRIGSLVKWKYANTIFIITSMTDNPFSKDTSVRVRSIKTDQEHDMFVSDLEIICE